MSTRTVGRQTRVRLVRQPGDGSCLYHSLCEGWNSLPSRKKESVALTPSYLRHFLSTLVLNMKDKPIAGTPLSEWIFMETGQSSEEYSRRMRRGGWGGSVECMLFADAFGVCVSVYRQKRGSGHKRWIGEEEEALSLEKVVRWGDESERRGRKGVQGGRVVRLLYTPYLHYDALVEE